MKKNQRLRTYNVLISNFDNSSINSNIKANNI